jgi:hypothetical protein
VSDAHRRPQPLLVHRLVELCRRKTVLGHVVQRERGRGPLVLAASAVRGRCPVYALGAAGLWNHVLLRTSSHLRVKLRSGRAPEP